MASKAESKGKRHEKLVKLLLGHLLGAAFAFSPPDYAKGQGAQREPSDVAWHFGDATILFFCHLGEPESPRAAAKSPLRGHDKHNWKQASGWMDAWRKGEDLIDSAAGGSQRVRYCDAGSVAIISVATVDGYDEGWVQNRPDRAEAFGVDCCLELSAPALELVVSKGFATGVDLFLCLEEAARRSRRLDLSEWTQIVEEYWSAALRLHGRPENMPGGALSSFAANDLHQLIRELLAEDPRTPRSMTHPDGGLGMSPLTIFGDVSLNTLLRLVDCIRFLTEATHDYALASSKVSRDGYHFGVFCASITGVFEPGEEDEALSRLESTNVILHLWSDPRTFDGKSMALAQFGMMAASPRVGPTNTGDAIRRIGALGLKAKH